MKILVMVKQVPDATEVKLDPKTGNLIREGVKSIINPDDRHALEAAVSLKEALGGKVTAVSMGPAQAIDALSEALGMGADAGVLLTDRAFAGADTWATSYTLGKAVERIGEFDLILCGRQAIDGDTAQIGPQLAEFLGIPHVCYVFDIEGIEEGAVSVKRRTEDGYERIQCRLPALLTVIGEINAPRYAQIGRMIDACKDKAPIEVWNAADIAAKTQDVGLEGSLTHVIRTFAPKLKRQGQLLEGDAKRCVADLISRLRENRLI